MKYSDEQLSKRLDEVSADLIEACDHFAAKQPFLGRACVNIALGRLDGLREMLEGPKASRLDQIISRVGGSRLFPTALDGASSRQPNFPAKKRKSKKRGAK